ILVKLFISEIVHTEDSFLLKLYYKFNFATEPYYAYDFSDKRVSYKQDFDSRRYYQQHDADYHEENMTN
ncbi:TPA: cystatin-like fold lipoprotein, partial [Staphylococcus aureus]